MSIKKALAAGLAGFCLAQSFNVATNPLTNQGFLDNAAFAVTEPAVLIYAAAERPIDVLGPLAIGGAAVGALFLSRKKKPDAPAA